MPNDSYTQQALAGDPNFRGRVRAALSSVAWQIEGEAASVPNQANRLRYAKQVIRNLDFETTTIVPTFVMRPNVINFPTSFAYDFVTQVGFVKTEAADADLTSQLFTDWDQLAAAAGFSG
jgi:hypothetical protein